VVRPPGQLSGGTTQPDPEYAYLTTRGRHTGQPHTVELWYRWSEGALWCISEAEDPHGPGRPDWVRNLQGDPSVSVRVGDAVVTGAATVLAADAADAPQARARRAMAARYQDWHPGAPLSRWAARGLAVRIDPS